MADLKLPAFPAGTKFDSIRLRVSDNGGLTVDLDTTYPRPSDGNVDKYGGGQAYKSYSLSYTTFKESVPVIEKLMEIMGVPVETEEEEGMEMEDEEPIEETF